MNSRIMLGVALITTTLGACNLETDDTLGPTLLDTYGGSVAKDTGTPLENGNAILNAGSFTLYSSWGDSWPEGACVELRLKNSGPAIVGWSIGLKLNTDVKKWVYEDGGYIDWTGNYVAIDPSSGDTKIGQGESHLFHYCAEPRTKPTQFWVYGGYDTSGSSGGSDAGCLSCTGGSSGGTGGTTPPPWTDPTTNPDPTAVTLTQGELTLSVSERDLWSQGGCVDLTLRNEGPALEDWTVYMPLTAPVTKFFSKSYDVTIEYDSANAQMKASQKGRVLDEGGSVSFHWCTEPRSVPRSFGVEGTEVSGGGTGGEDTYRLQDQTGRIGLALEYRGYKDGKGAECYDVTMINLAETAQTVSIFQLEFAADTAISSASQLSTWPVTNRLHKFKLDQSAILQPFDDLPARPFFCMKPPSAPSRFVLGP